MKKKIFTCLIEEHHEAFYVWEYLKGEKIIQPEDNSLIHVDEHSDFATPLLGSSIHQLEGMTLAQKLKFTYHELSIANFIVPSVYLGLIKEVIWIKRRHRKLSKYDFKMFVKSYNNKGIKLLSGEQDSLHDIPKGEIVKYYDYRRHTYDQITNRKNVLLDIDLDYFSCTGDPNLLNETKIEITKEEFEKYNLNPYHKINFTHIGRVESEELNGRYFYVINRYPQIYPNPLKTNESQILKNIKLLTSKLQEENIIPQAITICRSRYSGYTPKDQWEFIEKSLLSELKRIYNLKIVVLNDCFS